MITIQKGSGFPFTKGKYFQKISTKTFAVTWVGEREGVEIKYIVLSGLKNELSIIRDNFESAICIGHS